MGDQDASVLTRAGFVPSPVRDGWWRDAAASGRDYPAWRAVEIARRDAGVAEMAAGEMAAGEMDVAVGGGR